MALVVVAPALLVDSVPLRLPPERGLGSAVFYKANSMPRFTEVWWPHAEASGHHIPLASRGGIGFGPGAHLRQCRGKQWTTNFSLFVLELAGSRIARGSMRNQCFG
jgi:hypothetical protein